MSAYRHNARIEHEETPEEWLARMRLEHRDRLHGVFCGAVSIAYSLLLLFI